MKQYLLPMVLGAAIIFGIAFGTLHAEKASAMALASAASQSR